MVCPIAITTESPQAGTPLGDHVEFVAQLPDPVDTLYTADAGKKSRTHKTDNKIVFIFILIVRRLF
jgi:hypothetical protein